MLTVVEARVIGCLIEKQRTVPDQYPLTLNVLVGACNQATSRDPVMQLTEHEVEAALGSLKTQGLVRLVHPSHGRSATRYRQVADEVWQLDPAQASVVAVLLLRGPQTVAELKTRTERQHGFASAGEVEDVLAGLAAAAHVRRLERQPGQKEPRWQQLLADESAVPERPDADRSHAPEPSVPSVSSAPSVSSIDDHDSLREQVADLQARVARLEAALAELL